MGFELSKFNQETWDCLVASGHDRHLEPSNDKDNPPPNLADEWLTDSELRARAIRQRQELF